MDEGGGSNQKSMSRYANELSLPGVWLQPRPRSQSVCTRAGWVQINCKQAQGVMGKFFYTVYLVITALLNAITVLIKPSATQTRSSKDFEIVF